MEIEHKYSIPPHIGMMPIPHHLCDVYDPLTGWWVINLAPLKIGFRYPFLRMIARALNTFDINPTHVNPNGWKTLFCLLVIAGEHEVYLTRDKIICICFLKRNNLDKERCIYRVLLGMDYTYNSTIAPRV